MKCKGEDAKYVIKIRMHMQKVKMNVKNDVNDIKCPLRSKHDGSTEQVIVSGRENSGKQY